MGPPAESEYAVDPVGVDRSNPSALRQACNQCPTHHCLCQVLTIEECIDDGEVWVSPSMQSDFVHHLPP